MIAPAVLFLLCAALLSLLTRRGVFASRVLILGGSPLAHQIAAEIADRHMARHRCAGVIEDPAGIDAAIESRRPDRIVLALADRRGRLPVRQLLDARVSGIVVEDGVECYERLTRKIAIEALTPSGLIASSAFRKSHVDLAFGHALSLVVAAAALVVLAPLFAAIAAAVKLDSPGPVLFVHERVGLRGRRFRLLKFRTMRAADGPTSEWVRDNGHRITRVGRWLRRYRLDELPQLVNVLRGELNLVGPRPHPVSNFELFTRKIPFYSLRGVVRPGLTGWAQVRQGYANSLEEETEKMRYDLYYIKHMSAWFDLWILLETIRTVLAGRESCEPLPESFEPLAALEVEPCPK